MLWLPDLERSPFFLKRFDLLAELRQAGRFLYGAARCIVITFLEGLCPVFVQLVSDKLDLFEKDFESRVDFVALHRSASGSRLRLLCLSLLLRA